MFTDSPEHTNGLLDPRHYASFGLLLSILMMGWMTVTTLGTLNQISYLPQPTKSLPPVRLASPPKQTPSALHNRNFRLLFLATLLSAAINGTGQVFDVYMNLYFWQFGTDDIRWFSFALLGAAMAFVSVGPLQKLFGKTSNHDLCHDNADGHGHAQSQPAVFRSGRTTAHQTYCQCSSHTRASWPMAVRLY